MTFIIEEEKDEYIVVYYDTRKIHHSLLSISIEENILDVNNSSVCIHIYSMKIHYLRYL